MSNDNKPSTVELINAASNGFRKATEEIKKATAAIRRAQKALYALEEKGLLSPS